MENQPKKLCIEESKYILKTEMDNVNEKNISVDINALNSFQNVKLDRILNQVDETKSIFLSAQMEGSTDKCVLIMEKKPFDLERLKGILTEETKLKKIFQNDIYNSYDGFTSSHLNPMKVTMIYPATERHIQKYSAKERHLIVETPELYNNIVLPHIQEEQFSLQWLYNILEHKAETERIFLEDPDPENGFIFMPDLKWDGKNCDQLYCLAICHKRDLKSLRDLTAKHVPFLQKIKTKALDFLQERFQLVSDQIRIYLHYQPSYYHLHIHFTILRYDAPGIQCERGHLLDTVLCNLNLMSDYYSKATLTYALSEDDILYKKIKDSRLQL